jgi:MinD-like ATPase involved in chromosome partitioning or flagellar assembly
VSANGGGAPGRVTTFYSYKGGTGRSMLVANVAWLLASAGKRVLVMDWDLEAPGVHRYFKPFLADPDLAETRGIIQWLTDYWDAVIDSESTDIEMLVREFADPRRYVVPLVTGGYLPSSGGIDLLGAGRQDSTYAAAVASFSFSRLYEELQGEDFIAAAKALLCGPEGYDHVLIDSRTGISDTAGICTVGLADTLVVCFTYNNQSLAGAANVARSARNMARAARHRAAALGRPSSEYLVYGVPTRVDNIDPDRVQHRRQHAWATFADVVCPMPAEQQQKRWIESEIPYHPLYAYEEVLAACVEKLEDQRGVLGAAQRIARLVGEQAIGDFQALTDTEQRTLRDVFQSNDLHRPAVSEATAWSRFETLASGLSLDTLAEECFPLLVQMFAPSRVETLQGRGALVRTAVPQVDLDAQEQRICDRLRGLGLVCGRVSESGERIVEVADDSVAAGWTALRDRLNRHAGFMRDREVVADARRSWEATGRRLAALLELGRTVVSWQAPAEAQTWLGKRNLEFLHALQEARLVQRRIAELERALANVEQQRASSELKVERVGAEERQRGHEGYVRTRNTALAAMSFALALGAGSTAYFYVQFRTQSERSARQEAVVNRYEAERREVIEAQARSLETSTSALQRLEQDRARSIAVLEDQLRRQEALRAQISKLERERESATAETRRAQAKPPS